MEDLDGFLEERLASAIARHHVPGAVLGVLSSGQVSVAAAGTTRLKQGVPVTPSTIFQMGSVTKLYTATLVIREWS